MGRAIRLLFPSPPFPHGAEDRLSDSTSEKGHGQLERRTLVSSGALSQQLDGPGVGQVMQRTCRG